MIPNNEENKPPNNGPNCSDNSTDTFTLVFPLIPCLSDADGDGGCQIASEDNIYDVDLKRKFKSGTNEKNDVINFELRRLTMPYWMNGYEDEDGNEEDKITFKQTYYDIVYMQTQFNKFEVLLYLLIQTFLLTASAVAQNQLADTEVFAGTKVFADTGENFISFLTNEINTYLLGLGGFKRLRQELEEAEKALVAAEEALVVDSSDDLAAEKALVAAKQEKFDAAIAKNEINIGVTSVLYTDIKDLTDNDESYKQLSDSETEFRDKTMPERIKIIRESTDAEVNENNLEEEEESYFNQKKKDIIITILIDIKINNIIDLINGANDEEQKKKIFKILIDGNDNMIDIHTRSQSEDLIYLLQMCNYDEMIEYIKTAPYTPPPPAADPPPPPPAAGAWVVDGFVGYNNFEGFTSLNMFTPLIEGNVNNNPEPENLEQTLTSKLETETKPKINLTKLIDNFIKISDNNTDDITKYKNLDKEEMNKRRKELWETTHRRVERDREGGWDTYDDNGYLKVIEINNLNPHEKEKSEKGKTILDITDEYKKYVNDCELTEFFNLNLLDTSYQFHISIMENINVNKKNEIKEAIKTEITELDPNKDKFDGENLTPEGEVSVSELKPKRDALNEAIEKEKTSKVDLEDADAGTKGQKQIDYNTANEELKTANENLDEVSTQLTLLLERYNNVGSNNTELKNWYDGNKDDENYCKWLVLLSYLLMNDYIKIDTSTNDIIKEEKYDDNVIGELKVKLDFKKEGFTGSNNYEGFTSLNMFNSHKEGFDLLENNNENVFTKIKFIDVNNYKIDEGGEGGEGDKGGEGDEGDEGGEGGEGGGAKVSNPMLFPIRHQFEKFRQSIMDDIENTNLVDVTELPNKWVPTYSNMEIKNFHIGIVRIMDYIQMFSDGIETNFSTKEGFIGSQKKLDNNTLRDIEKNVWKEWDNTEFSGNLRLKELWELIVEKNKSKALMLNDIDINDKSGINCLGHMSGIIIFPYVKYKKTKNEKIIEYIFPDDRKNVREYVNRKGLIIESFSDFKDKFVQTCDGGFQYNDIKGNSVELDLIKDAEDIIFIY